MQYLGNNHVGFDAISLGFPSIMGCQAVVYHTDAGMFGMHDMKSGDGFAAPGAVVDGKADAFVDWIGRQINAGSPGKALYGVINRTEQYAITTEGQTEWRTMLLDLSRKLNVAFGFDGPSYGARINSHVAKGDSIYVRFDAGGGNCQISYKRWSKMEQLAGTEHSPTTQAVLQRQSMATGDFATTALSATEYDDARIVARIDPNKTPNLNVIAFKKLQLFT